MRKPKILMLSDNPFTNTGYSTQTLFLLNGLADKGYECHLMAHNYIGQVLPEGSVKLADGTPFKFTMYGNGREPYCKDLIEPRIREIKPDVFVVLLDTFMMYPWITSLDFAPAISFFWFPSDGGRFPLGCENVLRKFNYPVAMSKFGQKQVKDYYNINALYVPHAVHSDKFFKLETDVKSDLVVSDINGVLHKGVLKNKFVVGIMGRNQPRKMHDRAFKMFKLFAANNADAVLLCHFDPNDVAGFVDLRNLVYEFGLQNRVFFTGTKYFQGLTYEDMNKVYNVMDVYLSSTSGEGFGIGTIEAMSCSVPVLNTLYTTTQELTVDTKSGLGINLVGCDGLDVFGMDSKDFDHNVMNGTLTGSWNVERGIVDVKDGAFKLQYLYNDSVERTFLGNNGREAVLKQYDWSIVIESWDNIFKEVLK